MQHVDAILQYVNLPWYTFRLQFKIFCMNYHCLFRKGKKILSVITSNSFNEAELNRKMRNHMPIYKTLVITLPSVEVAYCKYCCSETHHCLSKQQEIQMQTEPTLWSQVQVCRENHSWVHKLISTQPSVCCKDSFNTAPTEITQRSLYKNPSGEGGKKRGRKQRNTEL